MNVSSLFRIMGWIFFVYPMLSLILPIRMAWHWKAFCVALLLLVAHKNTILYAYYGFELPPQPLYLLSSWLFSALIIALLLLVLKDCIWIFWKLFIRGRAFPRSSAALTVAVVSLLLSLYGTWNALKVPEAKTEEVALARLPQELDGLKIAFLADLHISTVNRASLLQDIVDRTNALNPDVILLGGDIVDGSVNDRREDAALLAQLKAPYGVWGVSGNHEYFRGYDAWMAQFKALGISMLEDLHTVLKIRGKELVVAGVADKHNAKDPEGIAEALRDAPANAPVILMAHRPANAAVNASRGVDLQLSGHTHGGVMPILDQIIARFNAGYVRGFYNTGAMKLYVSSGAQLWHGFPLRIMNPSKITLLVLRAEKKDRS